jgi:vacuolar-type H+-ATPase subunit D/Vma8
MAKPIFLIQAQVNIPLDNIKEIEEKVKAQLKDEYHVLIVANLAPGALAQFQCFNVDKMAETDVERFRKMIEGLNVRN